MIAAWLSARIARNPNHKNQFLRRSRKALLRHRRDGFHRQAPGQETAGARGLRGAFPDPQGERKKGCCIARVLGFRQHVQCRSSATSPTRSSASLPMTCGCVHLQARANRDTPGHHGPGAARAAAASRADRHEHELPDVSGLISGQGGKGAKPTLSPEAIAMQQMMRGIQF